MIEPVASKRKIKGEKKGKKIVRGGKGRKENKRNRGSSKSIWRVASCLPPRCLQSAQPEKRQERTVIWISITFLLLRVPRLLGFHSTSLGACLEGATFSAISLNGELEEAAPQVVLSSTSGFGIKLKVWIGWSGGRTCL